MNDTLLVAALALICVLALLLGRMAVARALGAEAANGAVLLVIAVLAGTAALVAATHS